MEPAACPKTVTQIGDLSIGKFSIPNGILCNFRLCQLTKHTRTYTQTLTRSTITLPLPTTSLFCAPREQKANIKYTSCVFIVAFKKIKKKLGKFKVDFKHSHRVESNRVESGMNIYTSIHSFKRPDNWLTTAVNPATIQRSADPLIDRIDRSICRTVGQHTHTHSDCFWRDTIC